MRTLHLISRMSFVDRVVKSFAGTRSSERFVVVTEDCERLTGHVENGVELQVLTVGSREYEDMLSAGIDVLWVHGAETLTIRFVNDYRGNALVVWSAFGYDYRKYLGRWDSSTAATLRWMKWKRPSMRTLIKRPLLFGIAKMGFSSRLPSEHGRFFRRVDYFCVSKAGDEDAVAGLLGGRAKAIGFSYHRNDGPEGMAKNANAECCRILRNAAARRVRKINGGWPVVGGVVEFLPNGGLGGKMEVMAICRHSSLRLPKSTYVRPGYMFRGWSCSPNGPVLCLDGECLVHPPLVDGKAKLYACWKGLPCQVVFSPNGGNGTMPRYSMVCGEWSVLPRNRFVRPMYEFIGWAASLNGKVLWGNGGRIRNPPIVNGGKTVLYAKWRGLKCAVRFDANGGRGAMPENFSFVFNAGDSLPRNEFVRRGYEFVGWAASPNGRVVWVDGAAIRKPVMRNGTVVLYAVWRSCRHRNYNLRFDANGGRGKMSDVKIMYGERFRLPKNCYVRSNFKFKGWAYKPTGPVVRHDQVELGEALVRNGLVTFYAIWSGKPYRIFFEPNGGRGKMLAMDSVFGESKTLPRNAFDRQHCEFEGWSDTPNGPVIWTDGSRICRPKVRNGVSRLFAQWKGWKCQVHFDANGGKGRMPEFAFPYKVGARIPKNRFERVGCEFVGWSLHPSKKVTWSDGQLIVRPPTQGDTVTLYAQWKGWTCRVKFNANGGEGQMPDIEFRYREWILLPRNAFSRAGYVFAGWMCGPSGEIVCEDGGFICDQPVQHGVMTLFAKWRKSGC